MATEKYLTVEKISSVIRELGDEFLVVRNPDYIHPSVELYPLAPALTSFNGQLPVAVVMDMDGTTTTTETLCIHSLETMVRRITGRTDPETWAGLDAKKDYPHIIGNSTTRHVEYLIETYGDRIQARELAVSLMRAAAWTMTLGRDEQRKVEVISTLRALGWGDLCDEESFLSMVGLSGQFNSNSLSVLTEKYFPLLQANDFSNRVRAAIDIYYYRYHEILSMLADGRGERISRELLDGEPLIEPMPGVAEFLLLIKGELCNNAEILIERLEQYPNTGVTSENRSETAGALNRLVHAFSEHPLKVAVVTSSIRYEADIVLNEVFDVLRKQAAELIGTERAEQVFSSPHGFYDAFITASDSSEMRLKPHRDLYSIALHSMGIMPDDFSRVIGFEDSESGTQAIRAAGIGLCAAVPFSDTAGHDLCAASHILKGGLPQAILEKMLFV